MCERQQALSRYVQLVEQGLAKEATSLWVLYRFDHAEIVNEAIRSTPKPKSLSTPTLPEESETP